MKKTKQELLTENDELRARLEEAEETLHAIRSGEVDALIVSGKDGQQIYTLAGADRTYRLLLESMSEGAVTLNPGGFIIYCNSFFAGLLKTPLETLTGARLLDFVPQSEQQHFLSLLADCGRGEIKLRAADNDFVPVYLSVNMLPSESGQQLTCLIVTDLSEQKRDEKLIAEEKLAQLIFFQAAEPIIICDDKGIIIRASSAAHHLCGENPIYQLFDDIFHLTDEAGKDFAIAKTLNRQTQLNIDLIFSRKDGKKFNLMLTSGQRLDIAGNIIGYVITLSDITERKRAEKALRESEDRLSFALATIHTGAWDLDLVENTAHRTPDHDRIFGYDTLLPQWTYEMFLEHVLPDDRPEVDRQFQDAVKAQADWRFECRIRRADGEIRWILAAGRHRTGKNGQIRHMAGIVQDITEHKRAEEALKESEESLRLLGDNLPDSAVYQYMYEPGGGGRFLYVSDGIERLTGISVQELMRDARVLPRQVPGEYVARIKEAEARSARDLSDFDMELPVRRPDGQVRWLHLHSRARRLPDGSVVWDGVQTDITGRKRAEEALQQNNTILEGVNQILNSALTCRTEEELGRACLDIARQKTQSSFGFIGRINRFGLEDIAISNPGWEACTIISAGGHRRPFGNFKIHGIYGRVITDGRSLFTNDPAHHPDSIGLPAGHPPLKSFLGVPLSHDGRVAGMLAVGNREGGYTQVEQNTLEALAPVILEAFMRKRAEQALRQSEERLLLAQEAGRIGVFEWNIQTGVNIWTPELEAMYGLAPGEFGRTQPAWEQLVHPEDRAAAVSLNEQAMETGMPVESEWRTVWRDGSVHWIYARFQAFKDAYGKPLRLTGVTIDITGRKHIEESLRESEQRFAYAMQAANEGLWDWSRATGKAYYSPRWKRMIGYGETEIGDDFDEFASRLHPDDREQILASLEKHLTNCQPRFSAEFRLRHKDGYYADILSRAISVSDASGAVVRMVGTHQDITERKALEKAQLFLLQCGQKEGEDFFESLAVYLAENLGMDFVCIDKLIGDRLSARTLAMYCDGKFEDNIEYTLKDTPCGDVVGNQVCSFARDVRRLFPNDAALQDLRAESYVGTTLWSVRGEPSGLMAVIGRKPLADTSFAETILKLVGIRAAGELERRQAAEELLKANKAYKALSDCGQLIMAARSETELLRDAVRIVNEVCGYSLVWIGAAEHDAAKTVRMVAQAGDADGYLDSVRITWDDSELGRGPTGTAIRTRKPAINSSTLTTPSLAPWRDRQLQHGYLCSAAFPMFAGADVYGALTVYSASVQSFTNEEIQLLMELSTALAYGIVFMRSEQERQQAEEALRASEERFRLMATSTPDHILMQDRDLRYTWVVNPQIGLAAEDMLGRTDYDFLLKADADNLTAIKRSVLETGESVWIDAPLTSLAGDTQYFEGTYLPKRDGQGRINGLLGYFRNVTARKAMENELLISNARLDILADTAGQLLKTNSPQQLVDALCRRVMAFLDCQAFFNFLADEQRGQLHLNACAGIPPEEAAKIEWLDYGIAVCGCAARDGCRIVAEDILNTPDIRTELVKSYGIQAYACHPLLSQGEVIGTLSFGTRTRAHFSENELSVMKAVADQVAIAMERNQAQRQIAELYNNLKGTVTELEEEIRRRALAEKTLMQYAEDLARSNEELESFASAVSHDLQEPLRSIAGFMRLLEKKYGGLLDARGRDYIERSVASAKRLGAMINSLLTYSRVTTRGNEFAYCELEEVLATAIDNLNASISQTKALITREPLPRAYGDAEQLARVLQNLIGNSIKYCGANRPEIHVSWQRRENACIISVRDNGAGIEPEYIKSIFDIFTRCSPDQNISGTGMGLALCGKIIDRHGGTIWAESAPGKGSTFFFSIPLL